MNKKPKEKEVLLSVQHLCQYFKLNHKDFKAVDDVSFDVHKGEVFGLVGESGCGKTTTGRSIIRLYNITSGNVYFKGVRIGAGDRSYKAHYEPTKYNINYTNVENTSFESFINISIIQKKEDCINNIYSIYYNFNIRKLYGK